MTKFVEKHRKIGFSSSNINEVIKGVLNFLIFFFYEKILHAQKEQKAQRTKITKRTKSTKTQISE